MPRRALRSSLMRPSAGPTIVGLMPARAAKAEHGQAVPFPVREQTSAMRTLVYVGIALALILLAIATLGPIGNAHAAEPDALELAEAHIDIPPLYVLTLSRRLPDGSRMGLPLTLWAYDSAEACAVVAKHMNGKGGTGNVTTYGCQ